MSMESNFITLWEFRQLVCFKVGRGAHIRFWEDCCVGDTFLAEAFPLLFRLSSIEERNIVDFIERFEESCGNVVNLNFHFILNFNDREFPQISDLITRLEGVRFSEALEDRKIWKADSSEVLSCKSAFLGFCKLWGDA